MGTPLSFKTDSSFSGPKTTSATSLILIVVPFTFLIITFSNSSSVLIFPKVLTDNSVALPEIFPAGNSTFSFSKAF